MCVCVFNGLQTSSTCTSTIPLHIEQKQWFINLSVVWYFYYVMTFSVLVLFSVQLMISDLHEIK